MHDFDTNHHVSIKECENEVTLNVHHHTTFNANDLASIIVECRTILQARFLNCLATKIMSLSTSPTRKHMWLANVYNELNLDGKTMIKELAEYINANEWLS